MDPFASAMALFWLAAEMVILVLVRWGARSATEVAQGREVPPLAADAFSRSLGAAFFVTAVVLAFSGKAAEEALAGNPRTAYYHELAFGLIWNALCAGWVGLEGAIALYVLRIDRLLHARAAGRFVPPRPPLDHLWLVFLWPSFAVIYNALAVASAFRQDFTDVQLERVLQLFIRFCGVGWILFELVVARSGVRLVRLLAGRTA